MQKETNWVCLALSAGHSVMKRDFPPRTERGEEPPRPREWSDAEEKGTPQSCFTDDENFTIKSEPPDPLPERSEENLSMSPDWRNAYKIQCKPQRQRLYHAGPKRETVTIKLEPREPSSEKSEEDLSTSSDIYRIQCKPERQQINPTRAENENLTVKLDSPELSPEQSKNTVLESSDWDSIFRIPCKSGRQPVSPIEATHETSTIKLEPSALHGFGGAGEGEVAELRNTTAVSPLGPFVQTVCDSPSSDDEGGDLTTVACSSRASRTPCVPYTVAYIVCPYQVVNKGRRDSSASFPVRYDLRNVQPGNPCTPKLPLTCRVHQKCSPPSMVSYV
ncbi:phosphoinositide-interacting protein [Platysternon megacephalum]|uniref:Phosphoinositide-interacting protein n=1 Tax=Platysternon megacephalum TaxID=55544 RepID=A0A4D9E785_9SAUR|nr:phosphoinositide-interacting protein [Platysternon megacephalum]